MWVHDSLIAYFVECGTILSTFQSALGFVQQQKTKQITTDIGVGEIDPRQLLRGEIQKSCLAKGHALRTEHHKALVRGCGSQLMCSIERWIGEYG